jgi:hypothetical protein
MTATTDATCSCGKAIDLPDRHFACADCRKAEKERVDAAVAQADKLLAEAETQYGLKFSRRQKSRIACIMTRIAVHHLNRCEIKSLEIGPTSKEHPSARSLRLHCKTDFIGKDTLFAEYFHAFIGPRGATKLHYMTFGVNKDLKGRDALWF